jgi:hypothetical protein
MMHVVYYFLLNIVVYFMTFYIVTKLVYLMALLIIFSYFVKQSLQHTEEGSTFL